MDEVILRIKVDRYTYERFMEYRYFLKKKDNAETLKALLKLAEKALKSPSNRRTRRIWHNSIEMDMVEVDEYTDDNEGDYNDYYDEYLFYSS